MQESQSMRMPPPENPVNPVVMQPDRLAVSRAFNTLGELPLPLRGESASGAPCTPTDQG